jgi:DnaJ-class molecular chaperone
MSNHSGKRFANKAERRSRHAHNPFLALRELTDAEIDVRAEAEEAFIWNVELETEDCSASLVCPICYGSGEVGNYSSDPRDSGDTCNACKGLGGILSGEPVSPVGVSW